MAVQLPPIGCKVTLLFFLQCMDIDLYFIILSPVEKLGWSIGLWGGQWLSGRELDSRPRGCGFEPHRHHCAVSLSKNINPSLVLVQTRKTCLFQTERWLMGRKESNQTNKKVYWIVASVRQHSLPISGCISLNCCLEFRETLRDSLRRQWKVCPLYGVHYLI